MTPWRFTTNARISRRVVVGTNGSITVTNALEAWFGAQWVKTGRSRSGLNRGGPRRERTDLLRYRTGALAPAGAPLRTGDRVDLDGAEYEIVESPREVKTGRRVEAMESAILAVDSLYPMEGALAEQGGAPVKASVRFSLYSTDETHDITGTYENYDAETDLDNYSDCRVNRQFVSGGKVYKITSAEVDLVGGYVKMTVRKSGVAA